MVTTIDTKSFEQFIKVLSTAATQPVSATVLVEDSTEAKKYGVLEFGSAPNARPWPQPRKRTVRGRGGRIYSKQAPRGFVHWHDQQFVKFLQDAYLKRVRVLNRPLTAEELREAANEAAERAAELIRAGAPVDTGKFKAAIKIEKA